MAGFKAWSRNIVAAIILYVTKMAIGQSTAKMRWKRSLFHLIELSPVEKDSSKEIHDENATYTKRKVSSMPDPIVSVGCAEPSLVKKNSSKETHKDDAMSTKRQPSNMPDPIIASCAEPSLVKNETRHEDDASSTKGQASSKPDPIASCAEPSPGKRKPKRKPSNKETQYKDNATSTKPKASSFPGAIAASYENNSSISRGRMTDDHNITMVQPKPYTMTSKLSKQGNRKRLPIPQAVISEHVENSRRRDTISSSKSELLC
jgi:hypothetical protein